MGGQYGVANVMKVAMLGAEAANVVDGMLNKEGIFVLFKLADEASAMASLNVAELKNEIGELDADDYASVYSAVKKKLDLKDDELEAKLEQGVDLVYQSAKIGLETLNKVSELIDLWKSLLKPSAPQPVPAPA